MSITDLIKEENGKRCVICQQQYSVRVLDFHHVNSKEKESGVSRLHYEDEIRNEAAKCILVCANCHREIHEGIHSDKNLELLSKSSDIYRGDPIIKIKKPRKSKQDIEVILETKEENLYKKQIAINKKKSDLTFNCAVDIYKKEIERLKVENNSLVNLVGLLLSCQQQ